MIEEYRTIKGFEHYEISSIGKVRRKSANTHYNFCVNHGYEIVSLYIEGKRYKKQVHRLLAEAFIEGYEEKLVVSHIDKNKTNNVVSNLQLMYRNGKPFVKYDNGLKDDEFIKYFPKSNRWRVQIELNKNDIHCLGFYKTLEEAKIERDKRIKEIHDGIYQKIQIS